MVVKLQVDNFGSVIDHISGETKQVKRFTWTNEEKKSSIQVERGLTLLAVVIYCN
jgi:hypothetical protein